MTQYTGTCYGSEGSRKGGDRTTTALRNPIDNVNKGQKSMRFVVAVGSEIMGGEIWVNEDTTIVDTDTFLITVTHG